MSMIATSVDDQPASLPFTGLPRIFGYMRHPVFSRDWFYGRTKLFGACGFLYLSVTDIGLGLASKDWSLAAMVSVLQWLAFMAAISLGPWLAVRVREKGLSPMQTKSGLLTATLCGMLSGMLIDSGAKLLLSRVVRDALELSFTVGNRMTFNTPFTGSRQLEVPLSLGYNLLALLLLVGCMFVLYAFYAGRFAIQSYDAEIRHAEQLKRLQEVKKLKQDKTAVDQQLAILQAQIEPHFLFNTLSSVRALVTQDAGRAAAMLDGLADYLRITLPKLRDQQAATLGEQVEICASYLELMRLRMGERFTYSLSIPEPLRNVAIPPLLLLPLIENAVTHGAEPKPGAVHVTLTARVLNSKLYIEVMDDGAGLNIGQQRGQGMGLSNVRRQLQLRFGDAARLEVSGRPHGGVTALMELPLP